MHSFDRLDLFKVLSEDGKNLLEFEEETGELCSACKANSFHIVDSGFLGVCIFIFVFIKTLCILGLRYAALLNY